jgi:hypothetical protein
MLRCFCSSRSLLFLLALVALVHSTGPFPLAQGCDEFRTSDDPPEKATEKEETKEEKATKHFEKIIRPSLEQYCYSCHDSNDKQADLDLTAFSSYESASQASSVWMRVLERVQADEMPPKGATSMNFDARQNLINWTREFQPKEKDCTKLASDRTVNFYMGSVMSRRLNRAEYSNSLSDLFGLRVHVGDRLPADAAGGGGFDTTGDTLFTSSLTIEKVLEATDEVLLRVLPDDEVKQDDLAVQARKRLLALCESPEQSKLSISEKAKILLSKWMPKAFRHPVSRAEVDRYHALFLHASQSGEGFNASLRLSLKAVLLSPHFLFLVEPEPEQKDIQPLGAFPLASRLSYFLWSTMPDDELFAAAASGELLSQDGYLSQVRRMIRDPKTDALGHRFAAQWLELDKLGTEVQPDPERFPEFNNALAESMKQEVVHFFNHLVRQDESLLKLIDSDYSFLDDRMIQHYGLQVAEQTSSPSLQQENFRAVQLEDRMRGGLTGMAAIHSLTSYPLRTSPVLRGRYVLEVLLGEKVPPPPPNVPPLDVEEHASSSASIREQLDRHRKDPTCSACHQRMDPLGFSLEAFDNLGRKRVKTDAVDLDVSGTLPDGTHFEGPTGLKEVLMARKQQMLKHLCRHMLGYALGRSLNPFDDCVIRDAMSRLEANNYQPSALLETIATSLPFRYRYYPK